MKTIKTLKTVLAASVLLAASNVAQATYVTAFGQPSSVVLTAFDTVLQLGYVRDLGIDYAQFATNLTAGNALAGLTTAGDTTFTTIFAGSDLNDIRWNITAGLNLPGDPDDRLLTSGATSPDITNNDVQSSAVGNMSNFFQGLNSADCQGALVCAGGGASAANAALLWGESFNGAALTKNTASLDDASVTTTNKVLDMFLMSKVSSLDPFGGTVYSGNTKVNITTLDTNFKLSANGTLSTISAVPLPAAVWLFGAGLFGLVGIGRRRQAS